MQESRLGWSEHVRRRNSDQTGKRKDCEVEVTRKEAWKKNKEEDMKVVV